VGDYEAAETQLKSASALIQGDAFARQPYYSFVWARLLAAQGKLSSRKYFQKCVDEAARGRDALLAASASVELARVLLAERDTAAAKKLLEEALAEATRRGNRAVRAAALLATAESEIDAGNLTVAQNLLTESREISSGYQGRLLLARANYQLSRVAAKLKDPVTAEKLRQESALLVDWMTDQVPQEYREKFRGRLLTGMKSPEVVNHPSP
jgi:hypothetical protein